MSRRRNLTLQIPGELYHRLGRAAAKEYRTRTSLVCYAVHRYLSERHPEIR